MTKSKENGNPSAYAAAENRILEQLRYTEKAIHNATYSRAFLTKQLSDPRRSLNDDCGFPNTEDITPENYLEMYDRNPIGTRVVEILPVESWKVQPQIVEDDDAETETTFEAAWDELPKQLNGGSRYEDKDVNPIWEVLQRVDSRSGIGHYGVLLLGFDDGAELHEPIELKEDGSNNPKTKLLYMRVLDEAAARISTYDTKSTSKRYGQPLEYSLTFDGLQTRTETGARLRTERVHWSRIIHVAEKIGSSPILAIPRQRPVYNNLLTLDKLYGGSGEMYYRGAFPGLSIESIPQLGGDVVYDTDKMKAQIEQYQNTLQRYLHLAGFTAKSLSPQVVDPTAQVDVQIEAICIVGGYPKRIFTGSERGELASSQDKDTWTDRLTYRQAMYITPRIIVPFIDRLIQAGVLPIPEQFKVVWPSLDDLNETTQSEVAVRQTEAIVKYVQGDGQSIIQPQDFLVEIVGLPQEKVEAMMEATMEELEEREGEEEERMAEAEGEVTARLQAEASKQQQEAKLAEQGLTKAIPSKAKPPTKK